MLVGGPQKVFDEPERWVDVHGVGGFNLAHAITSGTTTDFIDYVVPELRKRGRAQTVYGPGTFREKGPGPPGGKVEKSHPRYGSRAPMPGRRALPTTRPRRTSRTTSPPGRRPNKSRL